MKTQDFSILGLFLIVIITVYIGHFDNRTNYGQEPNNKEYNEYNRKHPIKGELKPFHPNIKNDFKIREFVVGTSKFYGELDGYGRSPFAYSGLANNPVDQEVLKNIVREIIIEELKSNK